MDKRNILFIGGDERQLFCAKQLYHIGYEVSIIGFEKYSGIPEEIMVFTNPKIAIILADVIILPTPFIIDGYIYAPYSEKPLREEELIKFTDKDKLVFGGKIDFGFHQMLEEKNIKFYDCLEDESLTLQNAYYTAEGTVFKMMEMSNEALFAKNVLIIGFGRIAKHLCKLLTSLKMNVLVIARKKSDITKAKLMGVKSKHISQLHSFEDYDFIINTVPVKIFKNSFLQTCRNPFIDLAGVSEYSCEHYLKFSAVPGKYAPKSAGIALANYIHQTLSEVEYE